jgi:hypothetical protein
MSGRLAVSGGLSDRTTDVVPATDSLAGADAEFRRSVAERAVATLDARELLFGRPAVPHQRGRA